MKIMIYQKQEVQYLGYIDKGIGPHISNAVYSAVGGGLCPTLLSCNYKMQTLILVENFSKLSKISVDKPN